MFLGLKSFKRFLKAFVPLALLVSSLTYFVYAKLTGFTPVQLPSVEEMKAYGPLLLPLLYIAAFLVRSGAALALAFLAAGFIRVMLPRHVLLNYLSSGRRDSYDCLDVVFQCTGNGEGCVGWCVETSWYESFSCTSFSTWRPYDQHTFDDGCV